MSGIWVLVALSGVGAVLLKAAGPLLLGGQELPARARAVISLLAPTPLAALIVLQAFGDGRSIVIDARAAGLLAATACIALRAPVLVTVAAAAVVAAVVRAL